MVASSKISRVFTAAFVVLCLAFAGGVLSACGPDHEQAIRDALTEELDSIKNLDEAYLADLTADESVAELEDFGIDPTEFFKSYLSGFDYRIEDVTVNGDTADATVVLTIKSFNEFNTAIDNALNQLLEDESVYTMSESDLYGTVGDTIMEAVNGLTPVENDPITVTYELIDNTWTPTDDSMANLEASLMAN